MSIEIHEVVLFLVGMCVGNYLVDRYLARQRRKEDERIQRWVDSL